MSAVKSQNYKCKTCALLYTSHFVNYCSGFKNTILINSNWLLVNKQNSKPTQKFGSGFCQKGSAPAPQPQYYTVSVFLPKKKDKYRREGKGRHCCLGDRIDSIPCRNPSTIRYLYSYQRRRINTEEKAKVVTAAWETELIQFLAATLVLYGICIPTKEEG